MRNTCVVLTLTLLPLLGCVNTPRPDTHDQDEWKYIAQRTVDDGKDNDLIEVGRELSGLKIRVRGPAIKLHMVQVKFGDGTKWKPRHRKRLFEGGRITFDIPHGPRMVQVVRLRYETWGVGVKSRVRLSGKK